MIIRVKENTTRNHFPHFSVELPLPFGKQKRDIKEGENADNLGLNGLVVSARK